jgi:hypothetical protein
MKANELRLGNYYEYRVIDRVDNTDTWELTAIDIDDLKWLLQNPDYPMYRPIEITDEWLVNLGFEPMYDTPSEHNPFYKKILPNKGMEIYPPSKDGRIPYYQFICGGVRSQSFSIDIKYVHQLQNLYHALYFAHTGKELILEIKNNA